LPVIGQTVIRKTCHITLVALLLVSTVGLTVNLHYCRHELYDIGVFTQAKSCCDSSNKPRNRHEHHACGMDTKETDTCEDETMVAEAVDHFVVSSFRFSSYQFSISDFFLPNIEVIPAYCSQNFTYRVYPEWNIPPPGKLTSQSFLQTYLI
jgi:hypothetical protein